MKKTFLLLAAGAAIFCGCKGSVGPSDINLSGSVLRDGTLIGGALNVGTNTVSLGGTYATDHETNSGAVSVTK